MHQENLLLIFAHEVKDSFSRLGGYLYALNNDLLTKAESDLLIQKLDEEFHENEKYTNELLMWAKGKRMTGKSGAVKTNILATISDTVGTADIKNVALLKNIKFYYDVPDLSLSIDRILYIIILKNMIKNALKFSAPHSAIYLKIELDDGKIITHIKDRGKGIDAESASDINVLFSKSVHPGTGSGMALLLCKELLKTEGGEIWATNNPDKGASFFFSLPFSFN